MEQNMEAMQNADNGRMVRFEVVCLNIKITYQDVHVCSQIKT